MANDVAGASTLPPPPQFRVEGLGVRGLGTRPLRHFPSEPNARYYNPKPYNPKPYNPKPSTPNPQPRTLGLDPEPWTLLTRNNRREPRKPKPNPQTQQELSRLGALLVHKPEAANRKPEILNPKADNLSHL